MFAHTHKPVFADLHEHFTCIMCLSRHICSNGMACKSASGVPFTQNWCSHLAPVKATSLNTSCTQRRPTKIDVNVHEPNSTTKIINSKLELFGIEKALLAFWSSPGKIENSQTAISNENVRFTMYVCVCFSLQLIIYTWLYQMCCEQNAKTNDYAQAHSIKAYAWTLSFELCVFCICHTLKNF